VWDSNPNVLKRNFGRGFDALFDFPWYLALSGGPEANGGVLGGSDPVGLLAGTWALMQVMYPPGAQLVRFPSNHDTNRVASATGGDARKMRLAAAASILSPGIPSVYYGEEIGMRGVKGLGPIYDEFRREPMDWYASETGHGMTTWFKPEGRNNKPGDGISVEEEEKQPDSLLNDYRSLIKRRKDNAALRSTQALVMDKVPGCDRCVGLWRWDRGQVVAEFFNFGGDARTIAFDPAAMSPVTLPAHVSFLVGQAQSMTGLTIEPWGTIIVAWQ